MVSAIDLVWRFITISLVSACFSLSVQMFLFACLRVASSPFVALFSVPVDLETFAEKGLQAHNHYRQEHHSSNLRWSDELATQAEKMAYDMAMRGIVQRSEVASSMGYGENVAKITGVPFNDAGSVATDIWYSESRNYSYSYPRVTPQTDAFTQMIWKGTKEIGMGCAKDVATNDLYVVALYRPPGNDRKFLRENVINTGTMTQDVYATIFKRTRLLPNSTVD